MELLQAIHGRRSVREFTDEPVSEAVARVDRRGDSGASAINQQPWCFVLVRDANAACAHFGPCQGAFVAGLARRARASLPRHAERPAIPHLLPGAGLSGDRRLPADRLGGLGLRARRREHDARRPRHWPRHLLIGSPAANVKTHPTRNTPRCLVFRSPPTVFSQPNTSSTRLRFHLADRVTCMPCRSSVNRAPAGAPVILRHMRRHIHFAKLLHEIFGVVRLVCSQRHATTARNPFQVISNAASRSAVPFHCRSSASTTKPFRFSINTLPQ